MDVFIKSFGRPFYLDRCLHSISLHLIGDCSITVLDDGTHPKYLEKVAAKYPNIKIRRSPGADAKWRDVESHLENKAIFKNTTLPVDFWRKHIGATAEIFLLLEEDAWLFKPVNAIDIASTIKEREVVTVKLFWGNCGRIISGAVSKISDEVEIIKPELPTAFRSLVSPLLTNTWRLRSLLTKINVIEEDFFLPYYTLYTVSSAFFKSSFWHYVFKDASSTVNEGKQLLNAIQYKARHPEAQFAKTHSERIKTTYKTASFNTGRDPFDMIQLNYRLSELWYKDQFDFNENLPSDFSTEYLRKCMGWHKDSADFRQWLNWISNFKSGYERLGIETGDTT